MWPFSEMSLESATAIGNVANWLLVAGLLSRDINRIADGVTVLYIWGRGEPAPPPQSFRRLIGEQQRIAASAIAAELKKQKIEAHTREIHPRHAERYWPTDVPRDAIFIEVGVKPVTYFFEQKSPSVRDLQKLEPIQPARPSQDPQ
jgi:hypothetical protein